MHKICEITADDSSGEVVDGTYITNIDAGETHEIERKKLFLSQNVQMWGMAVPLVKTNGRYKYYVITDCWRERVYTNSNGKIDYVLPKIEGCSY